MQAESIQQVVDDTMAANRTFNRLIQGFMGLGLVVGVAALGVISARAVVERRQQIGVLRAIGFRRGMVQAVFLLESSFIALTSIVVGTLLGLVLGGNIVRDTQQQPSWENLTLVVPWGSFALIFLSSTSSLWPRRSCPRCAHRESGRPRRCATSDGSQPPALDRAALPAALDRRFEAVVLDWDGTAVPDRQADASRVRVLVEELCGLGLDVAVITGTHVGNVDGQLSARPTGPGRLYLCMNRGSEVFQATTDGVRLLERREATAEENAALDRAAERTVAALAARGLGAEIVSQRLNRRKIDLIPEPEWADPPKARIAELLDAVQHRLHEAGLDGLQEAVEIAQEAAGDAGLPDARVTSDAKHVEIGLTDKADAARWVFDDLRRRGIGAGLVLVAGDEFGPLGGLPGSDSLLLVPEAERATAVSVGAEPTGTPPGVIALGGGPDAFLALLEDQLERRRSATFPRWTQTRTGR